MNNQRRIVCKVLTEETLQPVLDRGVDDSWFGFEDAEAMAFILAHHAKYGQVPARATFATHMGTTYKVVSVPEAWDYLLDELTQTNRWLETQRILPDVEDLLKAGHTDDAIQRIAEGMSKIEKFSLKPSTLVNSMDNDRIDQRWEEYENRESKGVMLGYTTGFPTIDAATLGLQAGQLVTVLAQPKVGKTTLCMVIANHIYVEYEVPILFVSFEMGHRELEMRQESLMAGLNFRLLQQGNLDVAAKQKYADWLDKAQDDYHWAFHIMDASTGSTVSALRAQIEKYDPALVVVDGLYMMTDELTGEQNTAQALTNITRNLKKLASSTKRPILINTQALAWKSKGARISMDSAGYSSSFAQDSDVILGLERIQPAKGEDEADYAYERRLRILASRNTGLASVDLSFDYDEGSIVESA